MHENVRKLIISLLSSEPVLVRFKEQQPLFLICDASGSGVGSVLCHIIDGQERPIGFHSRTLNRHEVNYTVSEQELLAVIHGIKKNRQFLVGRHFTIITDHHSLCFLLNLKDPHGRLARMPLFLSTSKRVRKLCRRLFVSFSSQQHPPRVMRDGLRRITRPPHVA